MPRMVRPDRCVSCDSVLSTGDRFCGECGTAVGLPRDRAVAPRARSVAGPRTKKLPRSVAPKRDAEPVPSAGRSLRPSRWWPESATGRVAFPMIAALGLLYGWAASGGSVATGVALATAALLFLTFWRNVWISWGDPAPASQQVRAGETDESAAATASGTWQKVLGIVVLLLLVALVRACGPDIMRAIL